MKELTEGYTVNGIKYLKETWLSKCKIMFPRSAKNINRQQSKQCSHNINMAGVKKAFNIIIS